MSAYRHPWPLRAALESLIPVVCPNRGDGLNGDLITATEEYLSGAPKVIRKALAAGAAAYIVGALAYPYTALRTADRLAEDDARRYFQWWWSSPLFAQRELAKALKGFLCLAYYEHPVVRKRIDYTPDEWTETVKQRRLQTYGDDIAEKERRLTAPDPLAAGFFDTSRRPGQTTSAES